MTERVYLIVDGNNLLMRSVHAAKHARMSYGDVETGPLLLFINLMSRYVSETKATHVVVCWDSPQGSAFRKEIYPAYKGNRAKAEIEVGGEVFADIEDSGFWVLAKDFCVMAGFAMNQVNGWEADDLIAVYAQGVPAYSRVYLLSGDKDLLQLVNDTVTQIRPGVVPEYWRPEQVYEKFGVWPQHYASYLSLVGDPGDNVPGVAGIGPIRATKLLHDHKGSLTALSGPWSEERKASMWMSHSLVYLPSPARYRSVHGLVLNPIPAWVEPDREHISFTLLSRFFAQYGLESVLLRLNEGTLWGKP